jgi:hypothetical protein
MLTYSVHVLIFITFCSIAYLTWRNDRKGTKRDKRSRLHKLFGLAIFGNLLALMFSILNEMQGEKNDKLIDRIDSLQNEVLYQITGGNSYCKMIFVNVTQNNALVFFNNVGKKHPLHRIKARVIELNDLDTKDWLNSDIFIDVGTLEPSTSRQFKEIREYRLDTIKGVNINVEFSSSNGWHYQHLRMRFVNGHWSTAERVEFLGQSIVEIDKDYPIQDKDIVFQ